MLPSKVTKVVAVALDQSIVSISAFILSLLFARYLGLEFLGRFSLFWAVLILLTSVQNALIVTPMQSVGPRLDPAEHPAYRGVMAVQQLTYAAFASVLFALTLKLPGDERLFGMDTAGLAPILGIAVFASLVQDYVRRQLLMEGRLNSALIADSIRHLGLLAAVSILIHLRSADFPRVLGSLFIVSAVSVLTQLGKLPRPHFDKERYWRYLRSHSLLFRWLLPTVGLQWLVGYTALFATASFAGPRPSGMLRLAQQLVTPVNMFLDGLDTVLPSRATRYFLAAGRQGFEKYLMRGLGIALIPVTGYIVTLLLFSDALIHIAIGHNTDVPFALLVGYGIFYFFNVIAYFLTVLFRSTVNTRPLLLADAAAFLVMIVLAFPLISRIGVSGAVTAQAVSAAARALVLFSFGVRARNRGDLSSLHISFH